MTTLHQTEVDGVRCFWVETGRPTLAALLVFRYGMVDEPFAESGFLHLLEHLSLHGHGSGPLHVNGQVGLVETSLDAHGPAELVVEHLGRVTRWLAEPTYDELERERKVLRAEAAVRGDGPTPRALSWRYGARGPGVAAYAEPGLGRATPELLTGLAHRALTRGNAALVLDGPPPPDLRLHLPPGTLLQPPPAVPVERFPAMVVDESGLVLSGVVPRSAAMTVAPHVLREALVDRLRHQDGAAYAPWSVYERVDADHAVLLGGSDVLPEVLPTLADTATELVGALRSGPDPGRLAEIRASLLQTMRDPYAQIGLAVRAASSYFSGRDVLSFDELIAEVESIRPEQVEEGFNSFADTLLLGVPGKTTWRDQLPSLSQPIVNHLGGGKAYRHIDWPAEQARLVVDEGAVLIAQGSDAQRVRLNDAVGVLAHENGLRHVVGPDGYSVTVNPHVWRNGADAVASLDAMTPGAKLLPMPAAPGIDQPSRLGTWTRWSGGFSHWLDRASKGQAFWFVLAAAVVAGGIALSVATGGHTVLPIVVVAVMLIRTGLRNG